MAEIELEKEGGVYVLNPNKAFVTIVAHESNEPANFKLSASYKPRDVASLTEEGLSTGSSLTQDQNATSKENVQYVETVPDPSDGKRNFYIMITLTALLIIVLITLIIVIVCRNRQERREENH